MEKKWIIFILFCVLVFAVWSFLNSLALGQNFFFQNWEKKTATITPEGLIQTTLINPEGEIKSVVVLSTPDGTVLGYWFFKNGRAQIWISDGKGDYQRNPEQEEKCVKCHDGLQTRL